MLKPLMINKIPILCPNCRMKTALSFNFGKKAHCKNCQHIWSLKWKGSKSFSNYMRNLYV